MAPSVLLRRSAVAGKVPTVSDVPLGALAMNTHDGKLFLKKDDGVESIVQVSPIYQWGETPIGRRTIGTPGAIDFGIADPPASEYQLGTVARRDGANARGTWPISVTGNAATATTAGSCSGNAATASAFQTARTISLTGDVTATSAAWNGNANLDIATTLIAEFSALVMMRERAAQTQQGGFTVGIPGTVPFGVGPVIPPGAAFAGIGPDAYNPVHLPSGSFC